MMSEEVQLWLKAEFNSLTLQLGTIKEQTNKTELKANDIDKAVQSLALAETRHYIDCPIKVEMDKLKKEMSEFQFIKKYYKVFMICFALFVAGIVYKISDNSAAISDTEKIVISNNKLVNQLKAAITNGEIKSILNNDTP